LKAKTVLFLCTGNYYRSRFAEILFDSVATKLGLAWRASSRALALERGVNNIGPMAPSAIKALAALGARATDAMIRMPTQATIADFEQAERVVALKQVEHLPLLEERFPSWAEKIEFWHVNDSPDALGLIEKEVMDLVARILGGCKRLDSTEQKSNPVSGAKHATATQEPITAKVGRETAGRRGKGITTVFDIKLSEDKLHELAATLKAKCGTGGTVKDGRIEIQGDQRDRVVTELEKLGYKVKRAGG
jgi:predicted translation initiation factor SUI1